MDLVDAQAEHAALAARAGGPWGRAEGRAAKHQGRAALTGRRTAEQVAGGAQHRELVALDQRLAGLVGQGRQRHDVQHVVRREHDLGRIAQRRAQRLPEQVVEHLARGRDLALAVAAQCDEGGAETRGGGLNGCGVRPPHHGRRRAGARHHRGHPLAAGTLAGVPIGEDQEVD